MKVLWRCKAMVFWCAVMELWGCGIVGYEDVGL